MVCRRTRVAGGRIDGLFPRVDEKIGCTDELDAAAIEEVPSPPTVTSTPAGTLQPPVAECDVLVLSGPEQMARASEGGPGAIPSSSEAFCALPGIGA